MLNLGVRAHDFGRRPARELALAIGGQGLTCIQLAVAKALPGYEPRPGQLNRTDARAIRETFAAQGVAIAVLGCYINPVDPDPEALEASLRRFEEHLRHAWDFGCPVVATETGSVSADGSPHSETASERALDRLTAVFRRLSRVAETEGVTIGVEGVAHKHTIHTHDRMSRLIDAVGSPALGVLYDPANFLAVEEAGRFEAAIGDALDRFGPRLVAVHAKDCRVTDGVKTGDLVAGTGQIPYPLLLGRLQAEHPGIPILLEDVSPETVAVARDFLRAAGSAVR